MPHKNSFGIIAGVLSALCFAIMAISSQKVSANIPASEISAFRGFFCALFLAPFAFKHVKILINWNASKAVWFRSLSGGIAVMCYFFNLAHGSAANAKALSNTNPLYVAILSWVLFKEKLGKLEILGLAILLFGALLLAHGLGNENINLFIIGNIGAIFTGVAYISLKRAALVFPTHVIVFTFSLAVGLVSSLVPSEWTVPNNIDLLWLTLVGITGLIGQYFLTISHYHLVNAKASSLTLLQSLILISYDIAWTQKMIFGVELYGNILILVGIFVLIGMKNRHFKIRSINKEDSDKLAS